MILLGQRRDILDAGNSSIAIYADLVDHGRVDIFDRWESQAALETFGRPRP